MKIWQRPIVLAFALVFASAPLAANAAAFTVTSNGLADNAMMPDEMRASTPDANKVSCGGADKAPGVSWVNPPAKTESYAILEVDPDGRAGLGVNHWVAYNIPASATGMSSAEIAAAKYTPGKATGDTLGYRAPCPPVGGGPHHYILTLFALDAPPTMPAGLDHDGVVAAMKGHVLGATTTVLRSERK